ncbi:MAG: hypothetical protein KGJ64_05805, partial [Betaproteobacteria bacterium]|nr:hypothetical protein [Betaproteobacteria bacterium]
MRSGLQAAGALVLGGCNRHGVAGALFGSTAHPVFAPSAKPGIDTTEFARYSPCPKPGWMQPFADPDFGSRMVRITDVRTQFRARVAVPAYSSTQAWNCDESRLILYVTEAQTGGRQGWAMLDGRNYRFLRFLDINPSDIEQFWWSRTNPEELLYISNYEMGQVAHCEMIAYNVASG